MVFVVEGSLPVMILSILSIHFPTLSIKFQNGSGSYQYKNVSRVYLAYISCMVKLKTEAVFLIGLALGSASSWTTAVTTHSYGFDPLKFKCPLLFLFKLYRATYLTFPLASSRPY